METKRSATVSKRKCECGSKFWSNFGTKMEHTLIVCRNCGVIRVKREHKATVARREYMDKKFNDIIKEVNNDS